MDSCQNVHHQNSRIIGICQRCQDNYLSCKLCFAELHYQHHEDFLLIDNILLVLNQVLKKLEQTKEKLKSKNFQQFNTLIESKHSQFSMIKTLFLNQNIQINHIEQFKHKIEDNTLNEILCQLILQSQCFKDWEIEDIKQIFIRQFQDVQIDHLIIQMLDRCYLLYSIQRHKEANELSQALLILINKKYFLKQSLQQLNQISDSKPNQDLWSLECLLGRNLYHIKQYHKSLDFFRKLSQQDHNEQILAECYIYLSLNLIQTNQYDEALNNLANYRTIEPNNILINFFEGYALEKMNNLEDTIQKYQELAILTNDLLYNLVYGKILLQCPQFNKAEEIFEKIIQNNNQNEIAQIYKCLTLLKGNKLEAALKQSDMLIETRQNSIYGYVLKGVILKMQGKNQEVNIISNQLNLSFPDNRWNYLFQSIILIEDSNIGEAYRYLQKIKDDTYVKGNLKNIEVCCLLKMNKIPEAFEILKEMQNYENYESVLNNCFHLITQSGMATFGALQYQKLFQNNPQDSKAIHYSGQCYYYELKYDQALECFNKAIAVNPNFANPYFYKGQSLFRTYSFDQALECYINASKKSSTYDNQYISFHKGNLYLFLFEFEKALEAYNHSLQIEFPKERGANIRQFTFIMIAIIYWYNKETQNAINLFGKEESNSSFMLSKQFQKETLGRLYQELKNDYQAQFYLNKFKSNNPEGTYNFQKKDYQHGQMYIKYMEKNSLQFEQLNDREYEIIKYAAWYLDSNGYDVEFGVQKWDYLRYFYQTINIEQNQKMIEEQLKRLVKYPII